LIAYGKDTFKGLCRNTQLILFDIPKQILTMDGPGSVALSLTELVASKGSLDQNPTRFCSVKKFKQILSLVTVEPVLFLYMLGLLTQFSIFQDLLYQKTCHQHFNASVCQHLNDTSNNAALDTVQSASFSQESSDLSLLAVFTRPPTVMQLYSSLSWLVTFWTSSTSLHLFRP
jgi:hypothetical protein